MKISLPPKHTHTLCNSHLHNQELAVIRSSHVNPAKLASIVTYTPPGGDACYLSFPLGRAAEAAGQLLGEGREGGLRRPAATDQGSLQGPIPHLRAPRRPLLGTTHPAAPAGGSGKRRRRRRRRRLGRVRRIGWLVHRAGEGAQRSGGQEKGVIFFFVYSFCSPAH